MLFQKRIFILKSTLDHLKSLKNENFNQENYNNSTIKKRERKIEEINKCISILVISNSYIALVPRLTVKRIEIAIS